MTSIGVKLGVSTGIGEAIELWEIVTSDFGSAIVWTANAFTSSSPNWHRVALPADYSVCIFGGWNTLNQNLQVCQTQDGNLYLCGFSSTGGNHGAIWQLSNIATIRATPATSPTWTKIFEAGVTSILGGTATSDSWVINALDDKLYARLKTTSTSNLIYSIYDGAAWTYQAVTPFSGAAWIPGDPVTKDGIVYNQSTGDDELYNPSGALIGSWKGLFGATQTRFVWRRQDTATFYVERTPDIAGATVHIRNVNTTQEWDSGIVDDNSGSRLSGAYLGNDKYFVNINDSKLYRAPNDLDFTNIATWNPGLCFNTRLNGAGDIVWVRQFTPTTGQALRFLQTDGTLIQDRTGDLFTVTADLIGPSAQLEMLNVGIVYNDVIVGDAPQVVDTRIRSDGVNAKALQVVGFGVSRQVRLDANTDIEVTVDGYLYTDDTIYDTTILTGSIEPFEGDRSVRDALAYQSRHTNDVDAVAGIHHSRAALDALYQPLDVILTALAALANAAGVLTNNGTGTLSWATPATGTVTNIATGTGLTGGPITTTGTISDANTGVAAATYGNASNIPQITVNAQGRITAAANVAISTIIPINVYNETQTADGVSLIYYLVNYAAPGTIRVYIDGVRQPASDDIAPTDTVTFSVAPDAGALLLFDYEMDQA